MFSQHHVIAVIAKAIRGRGFCVRFAEAARAVLSLARHRFAVFPARPRSRVTPFQPQQGT